MKYYNEAGHFPSNWGEKEIGYQGTSDSCPGSYFDGIQVKESFSPVVYTHENIQVEPDIQVRCFSYEDAGIPGSPALAQQSGNSLYRGRGYGSAGQ